MILKAGVWLSKAEQHSWAAIPCSKNEHSCGDINAITSSSEDTMVPPASTSMKSAG